MARTKNYVAVSFTYGEILNFELAFQIFLKLCLIYHSAIYINIYILTLDTHSLDKLIL